jgi:hypothetical protein
MKHIAHLCLLLAGCCCSAAPTSREIASETKRATELEYAQRLIDAGSPEYAALILDLNLGTNLQLDAKGYRLHKLVSEARYDEAKK